MEPRLRAEHARAVAELEELKTKKYAYEDEYDALRKREWALEKDISSLDNTKI
jgi:hypothetical protein